MKTLEDQMSFYAAYHQDARNKATHFVGVPMIIVSLLIPLAWLRVELAGFPVTGAMLFVAVVLAYYFFLDVPLALATSALPSRSSRAPTGSPGRARSPAGLRSRCSSSADGSSSSSGTPSKAASPRLQTTFSRSSSPPSFSAPSCSLR